MAQQTAAARSAMIWRLRIAAFRLFIRKTADFPTPAMQGWTPPRGIISALLIRMIILIRIFMSFWLKPLRRMMPMFPAAGIPACGRMAERSKSATTAQWKSLTVPKRWALIYTAKRWTRLHGTSFIKPSYWEIKNTPKKNSDLSKVF